ncbi:NAD kinase [Falsarthrobacter nasiphocae]|uniref:NAD kinase n=1 Tax=Falsarthrobacter nasiphocae TaxID=189863 RepID=A0AAE3YFY8_9MICC|nr:NAD kinase [Falsarthrobacter nasiphocae]MDR6892724.1 NAD+ kinase [Falsarthrobacter nasiphocae]
MTRSEERRVLVRAHLGREDAVRAAREALVQLAASHITPVLLAADAEEHPALLEAAPGILVVEALEDAQPVELCMVLGGDGSILRAAAVVREADVPLLGVNLGHVGFLAESERADLADTVRAVVERRYTVEERLALQVTVVDGDQTVHRTWALNEAAIEKENRARMIEVVLGVDDRPVSSYGCDGICISTPTGSTAYSFSAGGPVVWPEVEAIVVTPIAAHALFARPLVISPRSHVSVQLLHRTDARGVLWSDGREEIELGPGARVDIERAERSVRIARLNRTPFSERLVRKFHLPTQGWRGADSVPGAPPSLASDGCPPGALADDGGLAAGESSSEREHS